MRIAIINDIHFGEETAFREEFRKLSRFSERELNACVAKIQTIKDIDAVVQLGDLIERKDYQTDAILYQKGLTYFEKISLPVCHVIGNHEQYNLGEEDLRAWLGYEHLFYSFRVGEGTGLVLYSESNRGGPLRIGLTQLEWLKNELEQAVGPVIVFVHHPLDDQSLVGNVWFENDQESCLVSNRVEVRELLENSGKVVAVISAHAHWYNYTKHNAIHYFTLQSLIAAVKNETPAGSWCIFTLQDNTIELEIFGEESKTVRMTLGNKA